MRSNYNQEGIQIYTYELLFQNRKSLSTIKDLPCQGFYEIDNLTYNSYFFQTVLSFCLKSDILYPLVDKIPRLSFARIIFAPHIHKRIGRGYYFSKGKERFSFGLLEKHLKQIGISDCAYVKDLKLNFFFGNHIGHCEESFDLLFSLTKGNLVTGVIPMKNGNAIKHYVIEWNHNSKDYIIDYASDIIMKKEDYYQYMNFCEITRIDRERLEKLYQFCAKNHFCNSTNILGMFANEIYQDLEKNKILTKSMNSSSISF